MRGNSERGGRSERGNVLVFVTIALFALIAFAAWSTETGQAWTGRSQLQAATDSSALAGTGSLLVPNGGGPADPDAARAAAQGYGVLNEAIGTPISIPGNDVETGRWSLQSRTFTPLPGSTDPNEVRAVRVVGRRDDVANGPLPTVLGRVLGVSEIAVTAQAIGYLGYAGLMPKGSAELPITIDCCRISGPACDRDYCQEVANNPPNPCALVDGPDAGKLVTCLDFYATPEQNACWSVFDPVSPSVSAANLQDVVREGNLAPVGQQPVYLDNGTKTPVVSEVNDRFEGSGWFSGNPSGEDLDGDGDSDSWLVALPVTECQNPGPHCASGMPQRIVGVACFDVREIVIQGNTKLIKGEFVCPSDPRFDESACDVGFGPGGEVPTIDAQWPVLVH